MKIAEIGIRQEGVFRFPNGWLIIAVFGGYIRVCMVFSGSYFLLNEATVHAFSSNRHVSCSIGI